MFSVGPYISKYKTVGYAILLSVASALSSVGVYKHMLTPATTYSISVSGPTNAGPGEPIDFSVDVQNLSWFSEKPTYQWDVVESSVGEVQFRQTSPTSIFFVTSSAATKYFVITSVSSYRNYFVWGWQEPLGIQINTLTMNGGPTPTPTPNPNPIPAPNIPVGKFGIAQIAYDNFPDISNRVNIAQTLASNYSGVAAQIAAGTITTLKDVFSKLQTLNANIPSNVSNVWKTPVQNKIYDLYNNKKLVKLQDYEDLFNEVAVGLSYVK